MPHSVLQRATDIAKIISNYRKGELGFELDANHVQRWANQFSEDARDAVLEETYHVLSSWYYGEAQITGFLTSIYEYLRHQEVRFENVTFWAGQKDGKSQQLLLQDFQALFPSCDFNIDTVQREHIIYIDDGLYTGSKLRKEIEDIIKNASSIVKTIDVFVLIAYSNGLDYSRDFLGSRGNQEGVSVRIERYRELCNIKKTEYDHLEESYVSSLGVLWPSRSLSSEPSVKMFDDYISKSGAFRLKYKTHSSYSSQIFNTLKGEEIVEKEFLLRGLNILSNSSFDKGIYPLGYDINKSFGFGSFCATKYNISNTCPIVLWWDADSSWYPLLPRRIQ